jgi:branched-chain amino acid transport system ATP-binding protein
MMLTVTDLHSNYDLAEILRGVNLHVDTGEVVGLLGRNGMGKTTLVHSIAGVTPPQVKKGEVTLGGEVISGLPSYQVARRGIGLVPQGRHVYGSLSVTENLKVVARGANGSENDWTVERVFDFFPRLEERADSTARTLSGGEQQMLAIGRALMTNPRLLLMDEPSEGLAPIILKVIREKMLEVKKTGLSIFLVEQSLGMALSLCDRIYILGEEGRIAWEGTPAELDADGQTKKNLLGVG